MRITIHRGTDQIGGSVTEYEHDGWKLFVDFGEQLPGVSVTDTPEIDGLTKGDLSKSALLITHYHGDHIGNLDLISDEVPVYMGKIGLDIQRVSSDHLKGVQEHHARLLKRLESIIPFEAGKAFEFGPFTIMPIVMDHSAFDAHAFKIEADGGSVFHTGDFRTHGFRGKKLPQVIEKYIGRVDYVVCEATNVNRPQAGIQTEHDLQQNMLDDFKSHKYNAVYLSTTNIDRIFALYHAALKAGRKFIVDRHQKNIMDAVVGRDPIWGKSRLYKYETEEPMVLMYDNDNRGGFLVKEKFLDHLKEKGYVLLARANSRFDNLIEKLPDDEDKMRYLSMWRGYVDNPDSPAFNQSLAKSLGKVWLYRHTSGHCDMESLDHLFEMLRPHAVIPIHTDNPERFAEIFSDKWPIILMRDGEGFKFISSKYFDPWTVEIIACEVPGIKAGDEKWWKIDERRPIITDNKTDALFVLRHARFAPGRVVAINLEAEEDLYPSCIQVYSPSLTPTVKFTYGDHNPEGAKYLKEEIPPVGSKAIARLFSSVNALVPAEIIGKGSVELMREDFEARKINDDPDLILYDTFEEYIEDDNDWYWDVVAVRPLINLNEDINDGGPLPPSYYEFIPRVWIYPYHDLDKSVE